MAAAARPRELRDAEGTRGSDQSVGLDVINRLHRRQFDKAEEVERVSQKRRFGRCDRGAKYAPGQTRTTVIIEVRPVVNMAFLGVTGVGVNMTGQPVVVMHGTA